MLAEEGFVHFNFFNKLYNQKLMKQYVLIICSVLFISMNSQASNLIISGTPVFSTANNTLTFNITWQNSWFITLGPANYDGVWIFVKRQACSTTNIWSHALLSDASGNHSVSSTGINLLTVDAVTDGMGVFVHRSAVAGAGTGDIGTHTVTIKLSGTNNPTIATTNLDNFKIYGAEVVYVPQGNFFLGDGRTVNTNNFSAGTASTPVLINSAVQAAGLGVFSNYTSSGSLGCQLPLPASFPLGYNGFYCMKYEISAGAYTDFLNSLTYDQQSGRMSVWGVSRIPNKVNSYFDNGSGNFSQTYILTPGTYNTIPAIFTTISINKPQCSLTWQDLTAYLDWSGFRPMTEFEFEKACRGTLAAIPYEYPWGSTTLTLVNNWVNANNSTSEGPTPGGEGYCNYSWVVGLRCGSFANAFTNRSQAGATYYGILEMAGNVNEQCVGGGSSFDYSSFTTVNGDGLVSTTGYANTVGWPVNGGNNSGTILRGGSVYSGSRANSDGYEMQVSDRRNINGTNYNNYNSNTTKGNEMGGRGVRSY